jgi:protein-tyrosine phosphatase
VIDLHSHILPGVDDGADSMAEAVEMCRLAAADGCRALVATPHQWHPSWENTDRELLEERLEELRGGLEGDGPSVYLGGEIRVDSELLAHLHELPERGLVPLAGSHYLLLELDRSGPTVDPIEAVHEVVVARWRPILAHPELLPWLAHDLPLLAQLVEEGALLQITGMSLDGSFGPGARNASWALLERDLAHFVASDCHGIRTRRPGLRPAFDLVAAAYGEERARRLVLENPLAVLEDRPLGVTV